MGNANMTAAVQAEREACAETARCVPIPDEASATEAHGRISAALEAAIRIRARGDTSALAALLREAEARVWEQVSKALDASWREFDIRGYGDPDYAQGRADGREDAIHTIDVIRAAAAQEAKE